MDSPARRNRSLRAFRDANRATANRHPAAAYRRSDTDAAHGHCCPNSHRRSDTDATARNRHTAAHGCANGAASHREAAVTNG